MAIPGREKRTAFYTGKAWGKLRRQLMLERRNADGLLICEVCGKPITQPYDCILHHEIELTEENVTDPTISLNPELLHCVHYDCHNQLHKRYGHENLKQVFLVWGSPCAGKSTYIEDHATPSDLLVDFDRLQQAIGIMPVHHASPRLKANAFALRDSLLDQVARRYGKWEDAWIVTTEPLATNRQRMIDKLNAVPVHIDTDRDTCMARAEERGGDAPSYTARYWERLTT